MTGDAEVAVFHDQWATVTASKIVINGTTYVPASIASVAVRVGRGSTWFPILGLLVACFGLQFGTCGACVDVGVGGHQGLLTGAACVAGGLAFAFWGPLLTRRKYYVSLGIGGSLVQPIYSFDQAWSQKLADAIASVIGAR